jgi:hypothetical protein
MFDKRAWTALGLVSLLVVGCGDEATDQGPAETQTTTSTTLTESTTTSQPTTTTSQVTTTTAAPETETTAGQAISAEPLEDVIGGTVSGAGWAVEPGTYSAAFDGQIVILGIEEPVTYLEGDGRLDFTPFDPVRSGAPEWVMLGTFVGVIPPEEAGRHADHEPIVPEYTAEIPDDLGAYLRMIPQLEVEEAGQIEGDGFSARAWDIAVDPSQGSTFQCFLGDCVSVLVSEYGGVYVFGDAASARVWEFEGDGDGVYAYMQSDPDKFEGTVALAEMLFDDMRFIDSS